MSRKASLLSIYPIAEHSSNAEPATAPKAKDIAADKNLHLKPCLKVLSIERNKHISKKYLLN
jgi:hypothetical protein